MKLPKLQKVDTSNPRVKKKKILLLSDDMRMHSGVATMSRELVIGTCDQYDWVQLGGAIKHPDEGKVIDISADIRKQTGVGDASVVVYPISGYGNQEILREIIHREQPDAIMHFTDPRFWVWLYQMEHELRQTTPIIYYTIWDDLPFPHYNEPYYESCDLLMGISKQSANIVRNVVRKRPKEDWQVTYVPHGVNEKQFVPIREGHKDYPELQAFKQKVLQDKEYKFVLLYNNRNIRRKNPGDIVLAYKTFVDSLPEDERGEALLVMKTDPIDNNGTDLHAVVSAVCPDYRVIFLQDKFSGKEMNFLYNISDVTINMASNEGFGLGTCESLMAGTPIVVNVTGGLQDQCGFKKEDGAFVTIDDFDENWSSNHDARFKKHGNWVEPIFPTNRSLAGSPPTPYIFDDRCTWEDAAIAIKKWYDKTPAQREKAGDAGRKFVLSKEAGMSASSMCSRMKHDVGALFTKWTPRKRFELFNTTEYFAEASKPTGISPTIK